MADKEYGNKREAVRRVARDTGISESSIYKILANPFNFSKTTVETVLREAEKYGLTPTGQGSKPAALLVGVVVPSRPLYFWKEAVAGIEKSKSRLEAELGADVKLLYVYHNFPLTEAESARLFETLTAEHPDGLIIFPVGGESCRRFLESTPIPTVIFNDTQDYMTDDWFSANPHTAFIGPDGYGEGLRAAELMAATGVELSRLTVICTRHNSSAQVSEQRVRGVCDGVTSHFPSVRVTELELDPTERVAPSTLARRLIFCYKESDVDALYISSGVTHIACAAIEKIERRLGRPLSTFVIGHECSSADKRYLLEGRQRGYIRQDVYTQGAEALRDVVAACTEGRPLRPRLCPSSVFIR